MKLTGIATESRLSVATARGVTAARGRGRRWVRFRPYFYILPAFVFLATFTYYPFLSSAYLSLFQLDPAQPLGRFVGLANYVQAWQTALFWKVLWNNVAYALYVIVPVVVLAVPIAMLLNHRIRGMGLYRSVLFYPNMIPMAAAAMVFVWILAPGYGLASFLQRQLGLPDVHWLGNSTTALVALAVVAIWKRLGYYAIITLAGLQAIPAEIYDAGDIDGATGWRRLWYLTLPLLSPTVLFVAVIAVIHSFQAIDQVYLMTRGEPDDATNLVVYYIYQHAFLFHDLGYAAALTVILLGLLMLLTVLIFRLTARRVHYADEG